MSKIEATNKRRRALTGVSRKESSCSLSSHGSLSAKLLTVIGDLISVLRDDSERNESQRTRLFGLPRDSERKFYKKRRSKVK